MLQIDPMSRVPVYQQIIEQIERLILTGVMRGGDQLPSVRGLSVELTINPNTIQKAYNELDTKGIVFSVPGKGCFIREDADKVLAAAKRERMEELRNLAEELLFAGMSEEDLLECVKDAWRNIRGGNKQ